MKLMELLEQYPEAKEEYRVQLECLNQLGVNIIKEQAEWINKLEDMIIDHEDRETILIEIDQRYWYTIRLQEAGLIKEDENWYDDYL